MSKETKATYKFFEFSPITSWKGVVVAYPPSECPVAAQVVALIGYGTNPVVEMSTQSKPFGLLKGIINAFEKEILWNHIKDEYHNFVRVTSGPDATRLVRIWPNEELDCIFTKNSMVAMDRMNYAAYYHQVIIVSRLFAPHVNAEITGYIQ